MVEFHQRVMILFFFATAEVQKLMCIEIVRYVPGPRQAGGPRDGPGRVYEVNMKLK